MKKVLSGLMIIMISVMMIGCGGKPSGISNDNYDIGVKVIEITEQYLGAELTYKEAYDKIEFLRKQIISDINDEKYPDNYKLSGYVNGISIRMELGKIEDVREDLNKLKDLLNK